MRSRVDILFFSLLPSASSVGPAGVGFKGPPFGAEERLPRLSRSETGWCFPFVESRLPCRPGQAIWEVGSGSESALAGKVMVEPETGLGGGCARWRMEGRRRERDKDRRI